MDYVSQGEAYGVVYGTLTFFLGAALLIGFRFVGGAIKDADQYLAARNTQGIAALSLSFFASGAGAWVLFTVPEASIIGGPIALAGYTISCLVPIAIFGCIGPYMRKNMPWGCTFADFVQLRYGSLMNVYCTLVSLLYLCLYLTAEFSAIGSAVLALSDPADVYNIDGTTTDKGHNLKVGTVLGVSMCTVLYTAVGGLPVSLVTDKVQGVGILLFTLLVCIATFGNADGDKPGRDERWDKVTTTGTGDPSPTGAGDSSYGNAFKMAFILISAVTCANLMHSGFQQRVWAAEDQRKLRLGAIGGCVLTIPLMLLYGVVGMVSYAEYGPFIYPQFPSYAGFYALNQLATAWQVCAIILTTMMVASSADTIQTGVSAIFKPFTTYVLVRDWKLISSEEEAPRAIVAVNFLLSAVVINVPAIIISTHDGDTSLSVLSLFVLADLVCATCIVPVLMGMWDRIHPCAATAGCLAGAACALLTYGVAVGDDPSDFRTMLPDIPGASGLYADTSVVAFIVTPLASGLVTLAANIPWFRSGYRFAGFNEDMAAVKAEDKAIVAKAEDKAIVAKAELVVSTTA
jgi:Na+/proline symporter